MQTAIYFLLVTVCPGMHLLYIGDIVALGSLISIYFLFKSYQQAQAAGYLFYSFFFIGAGSILFPHPLGALVARSLPFPVAHSSQFLRCAARMDAALLDAVRTRLLL